VHSALAEPSACTQFTGISVAFRAEINSFYKKPAPLFFSNAPTEFENKDIIQEYANMNFSIRAVPCERVRT